jgi:hypothetical protein
LISKISGKKYVCKQISFVSSEDEANILRDIQLQSKLVCLLQTYNHIGSS